MEDYLHPRTNFAWAEMADCLKEEKQISIRKLLAHINGIDKNAKIKYLAMYKLTSQSIHGSSVGINLSFNDHISFDINELNNKNSNYYSGGISTVITHTMSLIFPTFLKYFNTFPNAEIDIKNLWKELFSVYVKEINKSQL
ncbi:hypothetical protein [Bacillus sp. USDA818B3_A]|uniref:hypothetical protein n=1 Tax=Bacillus sp. USDA818B3_A TaxID=2698834 RepID=UPI0013686713|nr:hypothetical protein [Bacillus sp. USDA818B3_A]